MAKSLLSPLGTENVSVMLLCPDTASVFVIVVISGALIVNDIELTMEGIELFALADNMLFAVCPLPPNFVEPASEGIALITRATSMSFAFCPGPPTVRLTIVNAVFNADEEVPPLTHDARKPRHKKQMPNMLNIFK
jgi:hypothetical protein